MKTIINFEESALSNQTRPSVYWDAASIFFLAFAFFLGLYNRLGPVLSTDFPLNDGGLFYTMTRDLSLSGYRIPSFTSYNGAQVPFIYPPLSFYLLGIAADIANLPLIELFRFVPAILSGLAVPAAYLLAREILGSRAQSALAIFAFSMLPRSFEWLIMGGGLTRATGYLFAILTIYQGYRLYSQLRIKTAVYTAIFAGLTILSHPEMSLFMAYSLGLLLLYRNRKMVAIRTSLLVAAGAGTIALPWMLVVLRAHGLSPVLAALQSGNRVWFTLGQILMLDFSSETFLSIIGVAALLGILVCILGKRSFLPVWTLVIALISPRSSSTLIAIPLAMLAAIGIEMVILPGIRLLVGAGGSSINETSSSGWAEKLLQPAVVRFALGFFVIYSLISARLYPVLETTSLSSLPPGERAAMQWAADRTSENSRFLVVSAIQNTWQDQSAEWFPALAERVSVATVQGYEWVPGAFYERWKENAVVQACAMKDTECIEDWAEKNGETFTHVYLSKRIVADSPGSVEPLLASLRNSGEYVLRFENLDAAIFTRRADLSSAQEGDQ